MLKLSIIGCGNVAKTMGYLWHKHQSIHIVDVVNRSQKSANASVEFISAGKPLASITNLQSADLFVIACSDDQIESCLDELLGQSVIKKDNIIFHFSGSKSSTQLKKAKPFGALCASLHPVKSFANPSDAIKNFAGTYCGIEGDAFACDVLSKLIEAIDGNTFHVKSDKKLTYHAASIFACNYLVTLQELSIKALEHSGVDRELAMKILEPIIMETSNNIFTLGTANSLTGPIARGDHQLVEEQYHAVKNWDKDAAEMYRLFGKLSIQLSEQKGACEKEKLKKLKELFG